MSTTAPDYLATLRDGLTGAVQQWMDQSTTAWDQWAQAWSDPAAALSWGTPGTTAPASGQRRGGGRHAPGDPHGHGHHHDHGHHQDHDHHHDMRGGNTPCGCGTQAHRPHDCGCGDACACCVPEADVVVRARAGELRVVPFLLRNPWRREREVALEVGPWHGCGGDELVVRAQLEEDAVVLAPCEDRVVRLLISTRGVSADDAGADGKPAGKAQKPTRADALEAAQLGERAAGDVGSCQTAYADVRFEGCARPQRVAVVVLPAECDAIEVGCDCGCCC